MNAVREISYLVRGIWGQGYQAGEVDWPVRKSINRKRSHYGWIMWMRQVRGVLKCWSSHVNILLVWNTDPAFSKMCGVYYGHIYLWQELRDRLNSMWIYFLRSGR